MEPDKYIIGSPNAPYWCKKRIMPYKKADGSTGYEYHGGDNRILYLEAGDILLRDPKYRINVRRKG